MSSPPRAIFLGRFSTRTKRRRDAPRKAVTSAEATMTQKAKMAYGHSEDVFEVRQVAEEDKELEALGRLRNAEANQKGLESLEATGNPVSPMPRSELIGATSMVATGFGAPKM